MTSVFDVAAQLIKLSGKRSIESVKLQKLCFYVFGWYAHLTGESLFDESFYAMPHGPVVGELLSAHAGSKDVTSDMLHGQFDVRGQSGDSEVSPYVAQVIAAVWETYKDVSPWELEKISHAESVWRDSWETRPDGSKRGTMRHDEIVDHFVRKPLPASAVTLLPDPVISVLAVSGDDESSGPHPVFALYSAKMVMS